MPYQSMEEVCVYARPILDKSLELRQLSPRDKREDKKKHEWKVVIFVFGSEDAKQMKMAGADAMTVGKIVREDNMFATWLPHFKKIYFSNYWIKVRLVLEKLKRGILLPGQMSFTVVAANEIHKLLRDKIIV